MESETEEEHPEEVDKSQKTEDGEEEEMEQTFFDKPCHRGRLAVSGRDGKPFSQPRILKMEMRGFAFTKIQQRPPSSLYQDGRKEGSDVKTCRMMINGDFRRIHCLISRVLDG